MKRMELKVSELDDMFVGKEEISKLSKEARWLCCC